MASHTHNLNAEPVLEKSLQSAVGNKVAGRTRNEEQLPEDCWYTDYTASDRRRTLIVLTLLCMVFISGGAIVVGIMTSEDCNDSDNNSDNNCRYSGLLLVASMLFGPGALLLCFIPCVWVCCGRPRKERCCDV